MGAPVTWFEIIGPEPAKLQSFYGELFGWELQRVPDFDYAMTHTHAEGMIDGGIGSSPTGDRYVMFYPEVSDPGVTLDRVESLGGKTLVPVTEMDMVTFAQLADPAGNRIGITKSQGDGDDSPHDHGPTTGTGVSWFEVLGPDPEALKSFYSDVFDWKLEGGAGEGGFVYYQLEPEGKGIGGGVGSSPDGQPHATVYAQSDDLAKTLERAESLGATTIMPPMQMENVEFAQFADPVGNAFGLWRPTGV
jgi:predicted enzyme related to lactoylglutathione lyase